MRPSDALKDRVEAVRAVIARYPFENPRVFGSVARREDAEGSDLDLLVDPRGKASYFDLAALQDELEALLGVSVDLVLGGTLKPAIEGTALRDMQPL
jgi:predicted nucleotidyltransferase